jgi:acetyl esterase
VVLSPVEGYPNLVTEEKLADGRKRMAVRPEQLEPYRFVRGGLPPSMVFQGKEDKAVPYATVELFVEAMIAAGNRCELKAYGGPPHGFFSLGRGSGKSRAEASRYYYRTWGKMDQFLVSLDYLRPLD